MPTTITARYVGADGRHHRVVVEWASGRSHRVLDCTDTATVVVETLSDDDDGLAQAEALARDYAAEHEDVHRGRSGDREPWAA